MEKPTKFLIFHDLEQRPSGVYNASPRHITLLSPLKITDEYDTLSHMADEVARHTRPFQITRGETAFFGPNHDVQAVKVDDPSGELMALHLGLLAALGAYGLGSLLDKRWVEARYNPHSTNVAQVPFPDTPYRVDNLSYYTTDMHGRKHIVRREFES